jgi:TonB family protein
MTKPKPYTAWDSIWNEPFSRLVVVLVVSIFLHLGLFFGLRAYATHSNARRVYKKVKFRIIKPKKRKPRPKPKRPRPKPKKRKKKEKKKRKKKKKKKRKKKKRPPPPPNRKPPKTPPRTPPRPVFGVTKKSLGKGKGKGMAARHGNTLMKDPDKGPPPKRVEPYAVPRQTAPPPRRRASFAPVPIYEVDENPREDKKVSAIYPPEAKDRGIQAVVIMSIQIRKNGRVRRVKIISIRPRAAKSYGFGKAAIRALKKYRFRPAKYKGKPVDVVVRYVYRFVLEE